MNRRVLFVALLNLCAIGSEAQMSAPSPFTATCTACPSGGSGGGSGSVTSVDVAPPSWLASSGGPVTTSGTITLASALGLTPGLIVGTCGAATTVSLCPMTAGMVPTLNQNTTGTAADLSTTLSVAHGGTNLTAAADDNVMVGNGATWQSKALADCVDTGGNHLNYTASTNLFSCGNSSAGGGSSVDLQGSTPGTQQSGNSNIDGVGIFGSGVCAGTSNHCLTGDDTGSRTVFTDNGVPVASFNPVVFHIRSDGGYQINNNAGIGLDSDAATPFLRLSMPSPGNGTLDTNAANDQRGSLGLTRIHLVPGAVGACGSGQAGDLRVAADGSLCNCNGSVWTPSPLTGSCS